MSHAMSPHAMLMLAGVFVVVAAIPGPCMIAISARAAQRGFGRGMVQALGCATGDMCFVCLTAFGLGWVATEMAPLFTAIRWIGAAYLFWLGARALLEREGAGGRFGTGADAPGPDGTRPSSALGDWLGGLTTCLSNPKVILFYGSVLPAFLDMGSLSPVGLLQAAATIWSVLMAVCAVYAWTAARLGHRLSAGNGRFLRRATGLAFIGCGVAVARQ